MHSYISRQRPPSLPSDPVEHRDQRGSSRSAILRGMSFEQGQSALSPVQLKREKGWGHDMVTNRETMRLRGRMGITSALQQARTAALQYGVLVESACEAFKAYVKPKLGAMDDKVSATALFGALAGIALGPVANLVGGKVVEPLAKAAWDKTFALLQGKLVARGGTAISTSSSKEALSAAVDELVQALRDSAVRLMNEVQTTFTPRCDAAIAAIDGGGRLTGDAAHMALTFLDLTPSQLSAKLAEFGLPTHTTAKTLHLDLYTEAVRAFEHEYVWVTASRTTKNALSLGEAMRGSGFTRANISRNRATRARAERKRALDGR